MEDIKIKTKNGKFRLRVSGMLIEDDRLLVHETQKFIGCCLPGGHVEIGESTKQAMLREMREELKIDVEIIDLFCINENIYITDGKVNQEINYYYKLKSLSKLPKNSFTIKEIDKGVEKEHKFHWIKIEDLDKENFKPNHISKIIRNNIESNNNIVLSDNR
mgnify:CR=1 FL=1